MKKGLSRREFLVGAGASLGGLAAGSELASQSRSSSAGFQGGAVIPVSERKRVLRIAHMTDIHVQPQGRAGRGMAKALHHAQNLKEKPDIIFNGGDAIMDALKASKSRTKSQWTTFSRILKNESSLPIVHCIGNHDVWGWRLRHGRRVKQDKLYGKQWAQEILGLPGRYFSFDQAGWHFIILDSTHPFPGGYRAEIDDEQMEWLKGDLAATDENTPICVMSHIPIICFSSFFDGRNERSGNWRVPGRWMHIDARRIKNVFYKHPNVKLCLSGHIHLHDKVEYLGVKYLCNGAVSGDWWHGQNQEFPPAYVIIDLYNDGTSREFFMPYS